MAREIAVVPYDERWPGLFEQEKTALECIFRELIVEIHHFGSTSVAGMSAKPIIDVMVIVKNINEVDAYQKTMAEAGYTSRGENGIPGRRYFVRLEDDGENHKTHIHMYELGSPHTVEELMFRDFLRIDREAFLQYEAIKKEAARRHRFSPGAYVDAKTGCVMELMARARAYYNAQ